MEAHERVSVFCGVERKVFCPFPLFFVDYERSVHLIGAGGDSGGRLHGNGRRMLAEVQRCVVVSTSCFFLAPDIKRSNDRWCDSFIIMVFSFYPHNRVFIENRICFYFHPVSPPSLIMGVC